MTRGDRQVPYGRLPVALNVTSPSGGSQCIGVADDDPRGLIVYTTAGAVILSPAQATAFAGELLARADDDTVVERMAIAMYRLDRAYGLSWLDNTDATRDEYRELARAAVAALRER